MRADERNVRVSVANLRGVHRKVVLSNSSLKVAHQREIACLIGDGVAGGHSDEIDVRRVSRSVAVHDASLPPQMCRDPGG